MDSSYHEKKQPRAVHVQEIELLPHSVGVDPVSTAVTILWHSTKSQRIAGSQAFTQSGVCYRLTRDTNRPRHNSPESTHRLSRFQQLLNLISQYPKEVRKVRLIGLNEDPAIKISTLPGEVHPPTHPPTLPGAATGGSPVESPSTPVTQLASLGSAIEPEFAPGINLVVSHGRIPE
ncbi:hypothetical protein P168DRAFT_281330 [Aspergillus campestris IBT 28561]|uniref:Uncharacterized protein n=1 Tax=Aspergillus campestris (strain IBT 28561) TaxID=1392248 RepID=A0A2I1D521_ASPC2|nr:uncharacterized protein P168DRAFT_281330 [Aspergillus campestris IBT 28561]PKY04977.1 hypothetical protein P168DRAFT_281330 [Aspergillus campestris IBT 28561]